MLGISSEKLVALIIYFSKSFGSIVAAEPGDKVLITI